MGNIKEFLKSVIEKEKRDIMLHKFNDYKQAEAACQAKIELACEILMNFFDMQSTDIENLTFNKK